MSKIYRCEKNHLLDAIEVTDEDGKCLCPHDNTRCHLEADTDDKYSAIRSSIEIKYRDRIAELEKRNAELQAENERLRFEHCGCYNCANRSEQGWGCVINRQKECTSDDKFYYWIKEKR